MAVSDAVRQRWRAVRRHLPGETVVTVAAGPGAGLRVGLRDASADYRSGTNELAVQEAVVGLLRPGAVFFDVGSNIGFFALLAARVVGAEGRVHAFEPVARIAQAVRDNVGRNDLSNVQVHAVAVAAEHGGTSELLLADHPGGATLSAADAPSDLTGRVQVPVVSLDGLVAAGTCPVPDVVKIDVEGAEMQVLDGMAALLADHRPALVVELDSDDPAVLATKVATWRERMAAAGYDVRDLADSYEGSGWHVYHAVAVSSR